MMSTMIDRGATIAAAVEVEKYSKQGTELLQSGHLTSAVKAFKYAYKYAGDLDDEYMERACAFNLGAAYIAMGQGEKGLNVLQQAVPSEDRRDGRSNGDLYFNLGLGYETTKNIPEAIRYFNKALDEYRYERDNLAMEIETLSKLATLCTTVQNHHLMNLYHQLAEAYAMQGNVEKQMWALCEKANSYNSFGDPQKAESAADECLKLSDKCQNTVESGSIFNDLGLLYTQLQKYGMAVKCFEEALPLAQSSDDKKREAVIRQNLGAAYNFVGEYQRAISFHKSAADMYARLQNRNSQGQCYANLAYAYSQLGDLMKAKQAFDHALLAAEDTDDNRTTWQVSEGLGSVAFNERKYDEAIEFFKKALGVLAARESNITAQNRIVEKLKQALEAQIKDKERPFAHIRKEDVNPLKSGYKKSLAEKPTRPTSAKPVAVGGRVADRNNTDEVQRRRHPEFVRVNKSGTSKRFSKVARGLSDMMEPFELTPRSGSGLQGETMMPVQSQSEDSSEEETESDENKFQSSKTAASKQSDSQRSKDRETASNRSVHGSESDDSLEEEETESSSEESEDQDKKAVLEQMGKLDKGEDDGSESEDDKDTDDDKDKGNEKMDRRHKEHRRKQPVEIEAHVRNGDESSSETGSSSSGSESGSTESESEDEPPPVPSGSLPKSGEIKTCEQPWGRTDSKKKMNYADINFDGGSARGEINNSKKHPNYLENEDTESLRVNMGTRASGQYDNDGEDEEDPLYQTIPSRSLKDDNEFQAKKTTFTDFSSLPRGEKEKLMYEKHRHDQLDRQQAPPLPDRRDKGEKDSKTCSVM
ncbi:uncharacterized protein LOC127736175 isoform X3 [Mytilus californianus]|uniref:uncharacterized protein LOC127736175 isoform X3 n=1 Tax=Mytilus californianus TaxID=6549 RepID=UPI0022487333|nr:uncharacterized protein LOC127736175 isoform X3 [Mytilus californianus]